MTNGLDTPLTSMAEIQNADWPIFGWVDDIRPALKEAIAHGQPCVLATLYSVIGSAPRGAGAQMLFTRNADSIIQASGYFSGDCIEGDVAQHAVHVFEDHAPRQLHYGHGSPWMDIRLRCGGTLHILLEYLSPSSQAVHDLLRHAEERCACVWQSDGKNQIVVSESGPLLSHAAEPFSIRRRFTPPRRIIISGGDPGALALAQLATMAQFETILIRPSGPHTPPPFKLSQYLREEPARALMHLKPDPWTAYLGATHEDHHDLPACLTSLQHGAGYTGMIGAKSRAPERLATLQSLGASDLQLAKLCLSPGHADLGKSPWEVATGIMAEIMQALNPAHDRA